MKISWHQHIIWGWLAVVALLSWSCGSDPSASQEGTAGRGGSSSVAGAANRTAGGMNSTGISGAGFANSLPGMAGAPAGTCRLAAATPLPASSIVSQGVSNVPTETPKTAVFVQDLFDNFRALCGACHVEADRGHFSVTQNNFANVVDQKALDRILASNESDIMPPASAGGMLANKRSVEDPVLVFARHLEQWIAAGRPRDVFYIAGKETPVETTQTSYRLKGSVAQAMTSVGSCVPDPSIIGTEKSKMAELDAKFAAMVRLPPGQGSVLDRIGLPEHLRDTDLFTLDSEALAHYGVIAYAPAYPLWTDDAGKLRYVRVPSGTSIRYLPESQTFAIPPNTRFYKTFSREVVEADGVKRHRKIETRVLVTRPDVAQADGSARSAALFGTYVWNEDETDALLLTDPLRSGEPFRDRLITVITDEVKANAVRATSPSNLSYALESANAVRRYAIPGSARCVHCHMGSQSRDFVLGFIPLQMHHRAVGEGGMIESSGSDALSQLERLVKYGIITGLSGTEADAPLLEHQQGDRPPRNAQEIRAQGYVLGNCAHCHNPRGFPSVENPALAQDLDFLPSKTGGIYQFPLERTSQRIFRGKGGRIPIPYVTPSLVDYPVDDDIAHQFWTPKSDITGRWWPEDAFEVNASASGLPANTGIPIGIVFAPWRSLIYRNVDTPFTYSDNFALFPHMPMDSPGNDCRAHQILGDWMVSIPATRKQPTIWEYAAPNDQVGYGSCLVNGTKLCDQEPQPYVEVKSTDPNYAAAVASANDRLTMFHSGLPNWFLPWAGPVMSRYDYCPENLDIVDRSVGRSGTTCNVKSIPESAQITATVAGRSNLKMPDLGVPLRSHFVVTDLTDTPGDYQPRRGDWQTVLIDKTFPTLTGTDCSLLAKRQSEEKRLVNMLQSVNISAALRQYANSELPIALWKGKSNCDLTHVPNVSTFAGATRPQWMDRVGASHANDAVFTQKPGAAIFGMICINCHGRNADSRGRMADNLVTMTGGTVRVANLRDGLFGPASAPKDNYQRVFGDVANHLGTTAQDIAARYLSWMALGGTTSRIPPSILNIVGNTQVYGEPRNSSAFQSITSESANMLATAQELCRHVLPWQPGNSIVDFDPISGTFDFRFSALVNTNGDAEMWQKLCAIDNAAPIHAVTVTGWNEVTPRFRIETFGRLYRAAGYPTDTPIGDHRGRVQPRLDSENLFPWCIVKPSDATNASLAEAYVTEHPIAGGAMPFCPPAIIDTSYVMRQDPLRQSDLRDLEEWATRGAINAGLAVFLYLEQVVSEKLAPKPAYDQCELLSH